MEALLRRYAEEPTNELEARIWCRDYDTWSNAFRTVALVKNGTYEITQTIIIIQEDQPSAQKRKEISFIKGVKTEEIHIIKRRLAATSLNFGNTSVKLALSEEKPIATFPLAQAKLIRLRLRASYYLDELPRWRIDFTYIWTLQPNQFALLTTYKNKLFPGAAPKKDEYLDFIVSLGTPSIASWELELEYIPSHTHSTTPMLEKNAVHDVLLKFLQIIEPNTSQNRHHTQNNVMDDILAKFAYRAKVGKKARRSFAQFVNKPVSFSYDEFQQILVPNIHNYFLSDKADGERALIYITTMVEMIRASGATTLDIPTHTYADTILDAEIVQNKIYIFDVLMLKGIDKTVEPFEKREALIADIATAFAPKMEKKIQIRLSADTYSASIKEVYDRGSRLYPIDGLIFTPADGGYFDMVVYKWKPIERITIDFLIIRAPKEILGIKPYDIQEGHVLYFLLCGISFHNFKLLGLEYFPKYADVMKDLHINLRADYFPIQFSPASMPNAYLFWSTKIDLHAHVGEFIYHSDDQSNKGWELVKMRPDKDIDVQNGISFGNDFIVAERTFQQFFHPFTLEMLMHPILSSPHEDDDLIVDGGSYFQTRKSPAYRTMTKFNAFVKAQVLRQFEKKNFVIDLACGKGQDLYTYVGYGIRNLLFIDKDPDALAELTTRRYALQDDNFYIYAPKPRIMPAIYTKEVDLTLSTKILLPMLRKGVPPLQSTQADGVAINFALHYILSDEKHLIQFVELVDALLRPGGIWCFTCFNGERIFDLLRNIKPDETWNAGTLGSSSGSLATPKYSIKKLYYADTMSNFGQKIAVVHPFTKGEYYEEYLVNPSVIISAFEQKGYQIRQNGSFIDWIGKFKAWRHSIASELTRDDLFYASLYQYVSLWKPI